MKRLGLFVLLPCLAIACDLQQKEVGDSGEVSDSNGEGGESGGSESGSGGGEGESAGCSLVGCEDGLFVSMTHSGLVDGNYQIMMSDAQTEAQHFSCDFGVVGGQIDDPDCLASIGVSGELQVTLPPDLAHVHIEVLLDGAPVGSATVDPEYQEVAPNGPECGPICTQATVTFALDLPAASCDELELEFIAEVELVRGCSDASECGQVMQGTSCGCTRAWVARNDADLTRFEELADAGSALECDWAFFGSTCDCPEADGFACIDDICTWNYL